MKRLKQLEQETARLKSMLAERDLELDVMNKINERKWRAGSPGVSWPNWQPYNVITRPDCIFGRSLNERRG